MQSISRIQAIFTISVGALLGSSYAIPWCPSASDRTINCYNCIIELTCDAHSLGTININSDYVIFQGNGHVLSKSVGNAINVNSNHVHIYNLYIADPTGAGIHTVTSRDRYMTLNNVEVVFATAGLSHFYGGGVSVTTGRFHVNIDGVHANGYGASTGFVFLSDVRAEYNTGNGVYLDGKRESMLTNVVTMSNAGHGTTIMNSPGTHVRRSTFSNNKSAGKNGLRVVRSNYTNIYENTGSGNGSYDCITPPSEAGGFGNSWGTNSGCP